MAKAKEESVGESEVKPAEKFIISGKVLDQGYYANIDGKDFYVAKGTIKKVLNDQNEQVEKRVPGSVATIEVINGDRILTPTGKKYFEGLTDKQFKVLASAGVIVLTKEQADRYKSLL
jgi:hypothetical protein